MRLLGNFSAYEVTVPSIDAVYDTCMNEKQTIEAGTAESFLHLYNAVNGTSFRIVRYGDAPDIECEDCNGRKLNLEITLTEDSPRDIQASLGRSDHRSIESLRTHNGEVRAGRAEPLDRASSLDGNVACSLILRLRSKLKKRYGSHTALVIRDSSGVDWDWDLELHHLRAKFASEKNPFDEGVWIVNCTKDRLFRLL